MLSIKVKYYLIPQASLLETKRCSNTKASVSNNSQKIIYHNKNNHSNSQSAYNLTVTISYKFIVYSQYIEIILMKK